VLPMVLVQAEPVPFDRPLDAFADEVETVLAEHPGTRLLMFPELHLCGAERPRDSAEPLAGPRTRRLAELAGDLGPVAGSAYTYVRKAIDSRGTLTEETSEPRRTIPRAILLTALIGGVLFVILSYATQLAHPGAVFHDESSAAFEIAGDIGGDLFAAIFLAGLMVAQFASGIAAQAGASRLMFAMGRDGVLPKRFFGYLQPKLETPVFGIVLIGLIGLGALPLDVTTSTSFITFGAFTAFTFVNLSVIAIWLRQRGSVLRNLVVPVVAAVDLWLLVHLDGTAITLGLIWLVLGVCYLVYLTRGFRRPPPEVTFED
jgi:putrescine importer